MQKNCHLKSWVKSYGKQDCLSIEDRPPVNTIYRDTFRHYMVCLWIRKCEVRSSAAEPNLTVLSSRATLAICLLYVNIVEPIVERVFGELEVPGNKKC